MKNIWLLFLLIILSCSSSKKIQKEKDALRYESLVVQFKTVFFQGCIYPHYKATHRDGSIASDFPLGSIENYQLADSLAKMIRLRIHQDSIDWTNQICNGCDKDPELLQRLRDNGMIGKGTLSFCLDYYNSEELDSIARVNIRHPKDVWGSYRKKLKRKKKDKKKN